ncbi:MAG TPA: aminotransferase class I/II-fold pyridoxal phosphate-dependent enzyme, partial [Candidatus Nitrosotenuis sp.]|nr:aminotransferase class I/II-fold pyridoxal phosphate-dependent enzyme [Candidatus Nitrosotenuis sp.]
MNNPQRIFLSPPHMSGHELDLIKEVFDSNYIAPLGPMVDRFEADICAYTGYSHAVALSSGTAALHLALLSLGIQQGDHIWASTLTFIASVSPITFCGAIPTFIDASTTDWNIDPDLLEEALHDTATRGGVMPKAMIVTDLYGQPCDYNRLLDICQTYGVTLISDAAESLGASYKGSRCPSPISAYSFNGNKIITTSGGGILASQDKKIIEYARFLSQQARDPFPYYQHTVIGQNYRMSNVLAAIGVGQLKILDDRIEQK